MINRKIIPAIVGLLCAVSLHAEVLSLKDCIEIGVSCNLNVANARIDMKKGRTAISQNRSRLLPVIDGAFQYSDFLVNPVNVTTGTLLDNDFSDSPTWQKIKSTQYNVNTGVSLVVPVYNQSIFAAIDVAETVERISHLSYEKATEDLTVQICKVYYLAQASKEQRRLMDDNILRMEELYEITKALYEGGVVMEVDFNRVGINVKSLRAQRSQYMTMYAQHINMLRYLLDMNPERAFDVEDMKISPLNINESNVSESLPELILIAKQQELIERKIKAVKAQYIPSVGFAAYAGGLGYHDKFKDFGKHWFGNCYIGLSVKIPLFDGNSKRLQIRQLQLDAEQVSNRLESTRKKMGENHSNASLQLSQNMEVYRIQNELCAQAQNVYDVTEEQYKEGVASMTALLQDEMQLRSAQTARVYALCQCNLAVLDLLKLSGNLSQLSE